MPIIVSYRPLLSSNATSITRAGVMGGILRAGRRSPGFATLMLAMVQLTLLLLARLGAMESRKSILIPT